MIQLQKFFFSLIMALVAMPVAVSCTNPYSQQGKEIADSITAMCNNNFTSMPSVILSYNELADSLISINVIEEEKLQEVVLNHIDSSKDTILLAAHVVVDNPADYSEWITELMMKRVFDSANSSLEMRRNAASSLVALSRFVYGMTGEASAVKDMEKSLNQYIETLDINQRAKLFAAISSPSVLASMLSADSAGVDSQKFIEIVRNEYASSPDDLKEFNQNLKK